MQSPKTPKRDYPLPHPENLLHQDVVNIATAITDIDTDVDVQQHGLQVLKQGVQVLKQDFTEKFRRIKINQLLGDQLLKL